MSSYRSAKESNAFPYTSKNICYIIVSEHGEVNQVGTGKMDRLRAVSEARLGNVKLYCVWPGKWTSDLFEIDDLDKMEKAYI